MKIFPSLKQVVWVTLFLTLLSSSSVFASNLLITRSFSGFWDQPDQESQGIILQIGGDEREFEVEIENVPAGLYSLVVDDVPVHDIEVVEEDGKTKGKLKFSNPQKVETLLLDFDPLGEIVEVFQDSALILDALFPDECPSRIQGNSDDKRAGSDAGPFFMSRDGLYVAGVHDCKDAGGRAMPGAIADGCT